MQDRIKEHNREIRLAHTQTSAVSEHANETGHLPLWNQVKFIDRDPHRYTRRVKEAIQIRLHSNSSNICTVGNQVRTTIMFTRILTFRLPVSICWPITLIDLVSRKPFWETVVKLYFEKKNPFDKNGGKEILICRIKTSFFRPSTSKNFTRISFESNKRDYLNVYKKAKKINKERNFKIFYHHFNRKF